MKMGSLVEKLIEEFSDLEPFGFQSLLYQCRTQGVVFDLERSLRIDRSGVYPNRLLVSLDSGDYQRANLHDLFGPCSGMKMPSNQLAQLQTFFPKAWRIHFGWELGSRGWIGKIYLELRPREIYQPELRSIKRLEPDQLLFLGYKWNLHNDAQGVVSKYKIRSHSSPRIAIGNWEESICSLSDEYGSSEVKNLIESLKKRETTNDPLLVLQVNDEGSTRVSYDINLYDLEQSIDSVRELVSGIIYQFFPLPVHQAAETYLASIASERLGHLATGVDRNGCVFWTLYYGAIRVVTKPG